MTVTGFKGGTGKSTTAFHIATFLSTYGRTVLIDGDPNQTALRWAERGRAAGFDVPFLVANERVEHAGAGAEYLIIDTPARPNSDDLVELASVCNLVILPTSPDIVSLEPMIDTARALGTAKAFRALITAVPPWPSREGDIMKQELKDAAIPVFESMVRRTIGFAKAAFSGRPIRDMPDSRSRAAWLDYESLGREIMECIDGKV